jgi:citrate synthase
VNAKDTGLRGVYVANTGISMIDETAGKLFYRGYLVNTLTRYSTYEETAYLIMHGKLPLKEELEKFSLNLKAERKIPGEVLKFMMQIPKESPPMDVLQSTISILAHYDPDIYDQSKEAHYRQSIRIIAKIPTVIAAWDRIRKNMSVVEPNSSLSHTDNFLYMLFGERASPNIEKCFDIAMIAHAEHSFNASTFAARIVASTNAHVYAAIVAAVGALSGDLHGGACYQVMKNLKEIGSPDKVEQWVINQLANNKKISGMGHAVYKTVDPRVRILDKCIRLLTENKEDYQYYKMIKLIEKYTRKEFKKLKGMNIYPNVDLYSAVLYNLIGIDYDLYPALFALSRSVGWCTHIIEQKYPDPPLKPVLYRPLADYKGLYYGPNGGRYIPINKRRN